VISGYESSGGAGDGVAEMELFGGVELTSSLEMRRRYVIPIG
jgi:hypothetical protein